MICVNDYKTTSVQNWGVGRYKILFCMDLMATPDSSILCMVALRQRGYIDVLGAVRFFFKVRPIFVYIRFFVSVFSTDSGS